MPLLTKVLFWTGFGVGVRAWQQGLAMQPLFIKSQLWCYPAYGATGALFGYWLSGVERRQMDYLEERKQRLLAKRAARQKGGYGGDDGQRLDESQMATP